MQIVPQQVQLIPPPPPILRLPAFIGTGELLIGPVVPPPFTHHPPAYRVFMSKPTLSWQTFNNKVYLNMVELNIISDFIEKMKIFKKKKTHSQKFKVFIEPEFLPLTVTSTLRVSKYINIFETFLNKIMEHYDSSTDRLHITDVADKISYGYCNISGKKIKELMLNFLSADLMINTYFITKKNKTNLLADESNRIIMKRFMDNEIKYSKPPPTAETFKNFINGRFSKNITLGTAVLYLHNLDYQYRRGTEQEFYKDGHARPDVQIK
jgi:hypothetical protein